MDGKPIQLLADHRCHISMKKAKPERQDSEYVRKGTCSIFLFTEPLKGWRTTDAHEHRTRVDWANQIEQLLTVAYSKAEKIVLVMDNLKIHGISSLSDSFPAQKAFELFERLEIHYTPKHGSWLNIAEIELSALGRQCLAKRNINCLNTLNTELSSWSVSRNKNQRSVDWQFTTQDSRTKLK